MLETQIIEKKSLREKRRALGLTQKELGEMFDLSQMHISLVELGQLTFLPHQRAAVESLLGPVDWDVRYAKLKRADKTTR
jgi:predicted transcriptional regulator